MNISTLSSVIPLIAWAAVIGVVFLVVSRAARNQPLRNGGILAAVVIILAILLTATSTGLVFINPDERGVVISAVSPTGYRAEALQPGLHWIIPFAETVTRYPIGRTTYTMSISPNEGKIKGDDSIAARTADGQEIFVDASVIFSLDPAKVVQIHIQWRSGYIDNLIRPQSRGVIRDAVSQFGVQEVYSTKRFEMVDMVTKDLEKRLSDNGLILISFVLRNITFSDEYAASVEQKQIAEQQAQQAKFVVEQRKQEAEQARQVAQGMADAAVIKAKGEAEARLIQAEAESKSLETIAKALLNRPELLQYQYITKLSPTIQTMLLPSDSPFIIPLPTATPK